MIRYLQRTVKDESVKELDGFRTGCWIFIENPSDAELATVAEAHGLERGLLDDAVDPNEVPRVESEGGVTYIFARVPIKEGEEITTAPLLIGVAPTFFFTVSRTHLTMFEQYLSSRTVFFTTQKTKLLTQIFTDINASFRAYMLGISRTLRSINIRSEHIANADILALVRYEEMLNEFLGALVPTHTLLQHILSGRFLRLYEQDEDLVQDLFLADGQLIEMCKSNLRNSVNIREAYSTIMTNNLNQVIKLLTALTVVFTIPTMVASFYGMNVRVPLETSEHAFSIILGGTVLAALTVFVVFQRRKWL